MNDPWEEHYRKGAPGWRGSPYELPELPKGARVLDIGCGTGSTLIRAAERGWSVKGIDISPTATEIAGRRIDERGLKCELEVKDITEHDLYLGEFDLVICHYVLGALKNDGRVMAAMNIRNWTAEGGLVSFEDLARGDVRDGRGQVIENNTYLKGNGIIQHFFDTDEVKALFIGMDTGDIRTDEWVHGKMKRKRVIGNIQAQ